MRIIISVCALGLLVLSGCCHTRDTQKDQVAMPQMGPGIHIYTMPDGTMVTRPTGLVLAPYEDPQLGGYILTGMTEAQLAEIRRLRGAWAGARFDAEEGMPEQTVPIAPISR